MKNTQTVFSPAPGEDVLDAERFAAKEQKNMAVHNESAMKNTSLGSWVSSLESGKYI